MSQSKKRSLLESIANVVVGYAFGVASQLVVFPIVGIHASLRENLEASVWFTGVSLIRSYLVRRAFNRVEAQKPQ